MEWKIGEIKQVNGEWYQCVEGTGCYQCAFNDEDSACQADSPHCLCRSDKKVVFKKLEIEIKQNEEDMEEYKMHDAKEDIPEFDKVVDECLFGEDKPKLKPFSLEAAKAGKPVCTRDGRKARIICFDMNSFNNHIIVALITEENGTESISSYTSEGKWKETETENDLMMLPEKRSGWINVKKDAGLFKSREEAERNCTEGYAPVMVEFEI